MRDLWKRKLVSSTSQSVPQIDPPCPSLVSDAVYERKLIQVSACVVAEWKIEHPFFQLTQMHGELLELNESLQKQLQLKSAAGQRLKDELIALRGPVSALICYH